MSNFKCFEMEDIAYKEWMEWSDSLDLVANSRTNSWLPAYGYHASQTQELTHGQSDTSSDGSLTGQQQSLFLETIIEETSDDLCSESDKSGPTGWNSDSDADSVIHLPKHQGNLPEIRHDWRTTEFEVDPPKKHKRKMHDRVVHSDDEETPEVGESTSLSSRSSSLIAFESLERHCEDVFKTTSSSDPFGHEIHTDPFKWKLFSSDSLEDTHGFSTDDDGSSSSDETLHRSHSSHGSFRSSLTNDSRLRSYRSFDSLNLLENPSEIDYSISELSQSHNALDIEKEKEMQQELVVRDKKLTATTADLSTVTDSYDVGYFMTKGMGLPFRRRQELASFHYREVKNTRKTNEDDAKDEIKSTFRGRKSYSAEGLKSQLPVVQEDAKDITDGKYGKSEPCLSAPSKSQHSSENLSEDSGFGDQISVRNKPNAINLRNSVSSIPEDEDSSPLESSSSYYSDYTGSEEGSIVSTEGREHSKSVNKNGLGLKIAQAKESEIRGCPTTKDDDADVKYNATRSNSHPHNCATDSDGTVKLQGKTEELTAPVTFVPLGSVDTFSVDVTAGPDSAASVKSVSSDVNNAKRGAYARGEVTIPGERKDLFFDSCDEMNSKSKFDEKRQLNLRLPVASTPNLCISDEDYLFNVPSATSSLSHVPLKSLDDDCDDLRSTLFQLRKDHLTSSQNTKGVHFCPIVSEVSWREVYSEEDTSSDTSDPSTDEMSNRSLEDICMQNDDEEYTEIEEKSIPHTNYGCNHIRIMETTEPVAIRAQNGEAASRTHPTDNKNEHPNETSKVNEEYPEKKPVPPTRSVTPTVSGHMHTSNTTLPDGERITKLSVSEVHLPKEVRVDESFRGGNHSIGDRGSKMSSGKKSGKSRFGGFLERFSFRRLSNRMTSGSGSKKQKEKEREAQPEKSVSSRESEDIKIIPLHAPGEEEAMRMVLTPPVVAAKPPLPPCPPRMPTVPRRRPTPSGATSTEAKDVASSNMPGVGEIDSPDVPDKVITTDGDAEKGFPSKCDRPVTGLLETDLDTQITVQSAVRRPLAQSNVGNNKKARSLMNLGLGDISVHQVPSQSQKTSLLQPSSHHRSHHGSVAVDDRAKSMEFLLDKENQAAILPPENELQKSGTDRVMSEHQLRVQRSLQKLNIPDWYKNSAVAQTPQGFLLKRHGDSNRYQGWPGLGSKTTSLSSLGSAQSASARSPTSHVLSPSPTPHLLSRWSTSRLNSGTTSTSTSPCGSARSSFNYRQPYLGWRSQERLTKPRTPAERLAAGLLPQKQLVLAHNNQASPNLSEVRTSIKEVTSAIVHYVSGVEENGSKEALRNYSSPDPSPKWQPSPRGSTGRLCWLESSFVGSRPLDQPETPLTLTETAPVKTDSRTTQLFLDLKPQIQNNNHLNVQQIHGELLLT
ncbi:UNVERIFIED_CONTAM: hypothetical protein PYX00_003901 [Menopon gallinae]|uniref:Uncharacterized protein n=2 Tax=Menopon gallinae TaxID=328185 RepID=A0AAW2I2C3_9NEOP